MPIGIIIMAVVALVAIIAAKCCGIQIDPAKKLKNFSNDLRDRWEWLDKILNRVPKFRRKSPTYYRPVTLYVDYTDETQDNEPYYQPVKARLENPLRVSIDSISIRTRSSFNGEESDDFFEPDLQKIPRIRPKSLALNLNSQVINKDTVTPLSIPGSLRTSYALPLLDTNSGDEQCQSSVIMSSTSGLSTPVMQQQQPSYLHFTMHIKGTDFKRC